VENLHAELHAVLRTLSVHLNFVMFTDQNCTHRVSGKSLSEKKLATTAVNAMLAVQSQWPGWENERLERHDSGFKPPDKRAWTRWTEDARR
jgi:hypothetical protein